MSFFNKFNDLVFGPDDDDEEELSFESASPAKKASEEGPYQFTSKKSKVVNIAATTQLKVVVVQIEQFDEAREIADHIRSKRPVVINFEKLDRETSHRVFDFISGTVYALDGTIQKVANKIFLIAPYNIDIMADVRDELKNTDLFPWD